MLATTAAISIRSTFAGTSMCRRAWDRPATPSATASRTGPAPSRPIRPGHRGASSPSSALPMATEDGVYGVLSIYASVPDAFDAEEVALLTELAEDLAFGIGTLRTRLAHRLMAHVIEQNPTVVVITDLAGDIEYVNPRFTELTGYSLEEVKGRNSR